MPFKKCTTILMLLLIQLFGPKLIFACTCPSRPTVKEAFRSNDFVFLGKAISMEEVPIDNPPGWIEAGIAIRLRRYTFEIVKVIKGKRSLKQIKVITGTGNGDCGYRFSIGHEYVVYVEKSRSYFPNVRECPDEYGKTFFTTNICHRTTSEVEAEIATIRQHKRLPRGFND